MLVAAFLNAGEIYTCPGEVQELHGQKGRHRLLA
jgi:hypothetical protein